MSKIYLLLLITTILSFVNSYELVVEFELTTSYWKEVLVKDYLHYFTTYPFSKLSGSEYDLLLSVADQLRQSSHKDLYTEFTTIFNREDYTIYSEYQKQLQDLSYIIRNLKFEVQASSIKLNEYKNEVFHCDKLLYRLSAIIEYVRYKVSDNVSLKSADDISGHYISLLNKNSNIDIKYIKESDLKIIESLNSLEKGSSIKSEILDLLTDEFDYMNNLCSKSTQKVKKLENKMKHKNTLLKELTKESYNYNEILDSLRSKNTKMINYLENKGVESLKEKTANEMWPKGFKMDITLKSANQSTDLKWPTRFEIPVIIAGIEFRDFIKESNKELLYKPRSFFELKLPNENNYPYKNEEYENIIDRLQSISQIPARINQFADTGVKFQANYEINDNKEDFLKFNVDTTFVCNLTIQNIHTVKANCKFLKAPRII